MRRSGDALRDRSERVTLSRVAAAWALGYALYRGYYALGGTWAILGIPVSHAQWIRINAIAAGMLLVAASRGEIRREREPSRVGSASRPDEVSMTG